MGIVFEGTDLWHEKLPTILPDAPLVDMNENFDSTAVKMVETMDLDELTVSETGKAAKRSSETNTATVDLDDLELDKDKEEV